jgi:hypothetical protein
MHAYTKKYEAFWTMLSFALKNLIDSLRNAA